MLTHTSPCPPPDAGVAVAAAAVLAFAELLVVAGAAEGDALTELFGLKKSPRVFFAGDGDGVTIGEAAFAAFSLRARFSAAGGEDSVAAAGEGAVAATPFSLRARFGLGEACGDSAVEGDAVSSVLEAVAAAFLCVRCFAGEGDSAGEGD